MTPEAPDSSPAPESTALPRSWVEENVLLGRVASNAAQVLTKLASTNAPDFPRSARILAGAGGRVIVSGVGKSFIAAQKVAETFSLTGQSSLAMHPVDAMHGSIGGLTASDVAVLISNSGATVELVTFARALRDRGIPIILITGPAGGAAPLGQLAHATISAPEQAELGHGVVPSASFVAATIIGDALALGVSAIRGIDIATVARAHPGGSIGSQLAGVAGGGAAGAASVKRLPNAKRWSEFVGSLPGGTVWIAGRGPSAKTRGWIEAAQLEGAVILGINDIEAMLPSLVPDALIITNDAAQFGHRWNSVKSTRAPIVFSHLERLQFDTARTVLLRLGRERPPRHDDPQVIDYAYDNAFMAAVLAAHLGATRINLIGIDYVDHPNLTSKLHAVRHSWSVFDAWAMQKRIELVNRGEGSLLTSVRCEPFHL